jgi:hypothetical protein
VIAISRVAVPVVAVAVVVVLLAAAAAASAQDAYPISSVPDIVGNCRASDPLDCPVPPGEKYQAMYRDRCAQAPQQCTWRPDGTIMRWVGKMTPFPHDPAALAGSAKRE